MMRRRGENESMTNAQRFSGGPEESPDSPWSPEAVRAAGPEGLARLLGDVGHALEEVAKDPGDLFTTQGAERSAFVDLMTSQQVIRGAQDALEARTVVALAEVTRRDRTAAARDAAAHESSAVPSQAVLDKQAGGILRRDLSLITRCSPSAAGSTLASARRLVSSMPKMLDALAGRKVSAQAAYAVSGAASVLTEEQCRSVDEALAARLPFLDGAGVRGWRAEAAAAIMELDAEGAALRHRRARRHRSVTLTPGEHGMARFSAHLPALDARLLHKRLSLEAECRRAGGADAGHSALMADALVDTVLGRDGAMDTVDLDVGVIITDRALFRPDAGDAAQIEGYGPVPAEAVREQLRAVTTPPSSTEPDPLGEDGEETRAVLRRLYTHPTTGELVAVEARGRAFPPAMAKFLTWRDTHCRGPFCNAYTRQHDHIRPFSRGGPTSVDNGQDTCAHCNQKEHDAASVERIEGSGGTGHRVAWTGYSGITRVTGPTRLLGPRSPKHQDSATDRAGPQPGAPPDAAPQEDEGG